MAENNVKEIVVNETQEKNIFKNFLNIVPKSLRLRIFSALVMIPLAIIIIYSPKLIFSIMTLAIAVLMAFEWIAIAKTEDESNLWRFIGLAYIMLPCSSLIFIKSMSNGSNIILWMFLIIWITDTAAMFVGNWLQGPKLAPIISPHKTWSGLIGGILASMFIGLVSSVVFKGSALSFIILGGILAIIEQMSDLLESKFKRYFKVKDSGNIIPGHGGIMDRIDGLTLVAPLLALIALFSKNLF